MILNETVAAIADAIREKTGKEMILVSGITEEMLAKYRITKEQFYTLE